MAIDTPRILLLDSYDSFTYNLASLFRRAIPGCIIHIIKNDQLDFTQLLRYLPHFSAVVVGPGPGSPDNPKDIGVVKDLWRLPEEHVLPIFGVCLGLQSLCIEYGGQLRRLNVVKHGQISRLEHEGVSLFEGVGDAEVVRYHSLHVQVEEVHDIEPLAWADDGLDNGQVLMAAKHRRLPFYGVQYHPESTRTHGGGIDVLFNFWQHAQSWWVKRGKKPLPWDAAAESAIAPAWPITYLLKPKISHAVRLCSTSKTVSASSSRIIELAEKLGAADENKPFVLLQSAAHPGRFSILAYPTPTSLNIQYVIGNQHVRLRQGENVRDEQLGHHTIWSWISHLMAQYEVVSGTAYSPFWGGLVGCLSYELGVQALDVPLPDIQRQHPDVNLLFVERSIVFDNLRGEAHIQSLIPDDGAWISEMADYLRSLCAFETTGSRDQSHSLFYHGKVRVQIPSKARYLDSIRKAKDYLFSGDSYELCVTAPTSIHLPPSSSWERYKRLQATNPAPYSAYIRLSPTTFLASSPERFMSCSRSPDPFLQFRPIKGTLRKHPSVSRADAELALAGSAKEVAENLMIVDLIRHDLHGVVGDHVEVRKFCSVEEYETMWQMVSVIEGRLPGMSERHLGWETLRRSLPPGSMTGAPKKRSVEILQRLEDGPRGLYSGVFGYWCVSGASDWSVTIRTCFKHDLDTSSHEEKWNIGAGGAITALSEPEAEWDEMLAKLQSVLKCFDTTVPS